MIAALGARRRQIGCYFFDHRQSEIQVIWNQEHHRKRFRIPAERILCLQPETAMPNIHCSFQNRYFLKCDKWNDKPREWEELFPERFWMYDIMNVLYTHHSLICKRRDWKRGPTESAAQHALSGMPRSMADIQPMRIVLFAAPRYFPWGVRCARISCSRSCLLQPTSLGCASNRAYHCYISQPKKSVPTKMCHPWRQTTPARQRENSQKSCQNRHTQYSIFHLDSVPVALSRRTNRHSGPCRIQKQHRKIVSKNTNPASVVYKRPVRKPSVQIPPTTCCLETNRPYCESVIREATASTNAKALSNPNRMRLKNKNRTQCSPPGIVERAAGYTPKRRDGPA